jgi:hypothetical protein
MVITAAMKMRDFSWFRSKRSESKPAAEAVGNEFTNF